MGSLFGEDTDPIPAPDYTDMQPLMNKLAEQANNDQPWMKDRPTSGQAAFQLAAQNGLEKTMQGQAAARGVRSSQLATMGNNALANQQSELSGQAAIRDAMEREQANQQMANIYMQQAAQKTSVNQANSAIDQQNKAAQDRMIGMGLTAAGYAFGGPAGGLVGSQLMQPGSSAPTSMGANPYAGAAPMSQSMQYNPSQYNMGQGLKFQGGY